MCVGALRKPAATFSANATYTATGIAVIYHQASEVYTTDPIDFGIPYFSISLSLNVLLTLMIVTRLVRHSRDVRDAMGPLARPKRLHEAIITIFVESSALYAVCFLLYIAPWGAGRNIQFIFFPILAQVQVCAIFLHFVPTRGSIGIWLSDHGDEQVIAQFLIILRVAKQKASVGGTVVSEDIGSLHLSQLTTIGGGSLPDPDPVRSTDTSVEA